MDDDEEGQNELVDLRDHCDILLRRGRPAGYAKIHGRRRLWSLHQDHTKIYVGFISRAHERHFVAPLNCIPGPDVSTLATGALGWLALPNRIFIHACRILVLYGRSQICMYSISQNSSGGVYKVGILVQ